MKIAAQKKEIPSKPIKSSGNVFSEMGFSKEEAILLQLKTDMKIAIEREVRRLKLSPKNWLNSWTYNNLKSAIY